MNALEENYQEISPQVRELLFDEDEPVNKEENNLLFDQPEVEVDLSLDKAQELKQTGGEQVASDPLLGKEQELEQTDGELPDTPSADNGWQEARQMWPQINNSQSARAIIGKMSELAGDAQGRRILTEHPQLMLKLAALDLYGAPAAANQNLIKQAKQAGREEALREAAARGQKTARAAATGKKSPPAAPSLEEQVRQGIYEAGGKGLFG